MDSDRLNEGEWLVVLDGRKLLVFQNQGTFATPALECILERTGLSEPTRDMGEDRPGRVHPSVGGSRSAVESTDFHAEGERAFVEEAIRTLEEKDREHPIASLVIVAPPKAMADVRRVLSGTLRSRVRKEIVADLVNVPTADLQARFSGR